MPGPIYNWLCVAHSIVDVLLNAAAIRASQVYPRTASAVVQRNLERRTARPVNLNESDGEKCNPFVGKPPLNALDEVGDAHINTPSMPERTVQWPPNPPPGYAHTPPSPENASQPRAQEFVSTEPRIPEHPPEPVPVKIPSDVSLVMNPLTDRPSNTFEGPQTSSPATDIPRSIPPSEVRQLTSSKIPSSRIGRLFHYGGLAASLGYGAASEILRRSVSGEESSQNGGSLMLTESNVKRLVSKLTKMRGAALKLGQFMSIQDTYLLPPEVEAIFRRVQNSAHYMPDWQMEQVMKASFGPSWVDNFESFDHIPFAAASIGQVHNAVLAASVSPTGKPEPVAVKVQFPNVADSIESDLGYVKMLLTAGSLLPKGLFLDKTIQVMKSELHEECDYEREASFLRRFRSPGFLGNDDRFKVPWVWEGSTKTALVMEHVQGHSVGAASVHELTQRDRNDIATRVIDLCLKELFVFRTMQTDPNWTNFLWNPHTHQIELVDFGASREYSVEFIDNWFGLLDAAVSGDRQACIEWSLKLGYLTGQENELMLDAHAKSVLSLGVPFRRTTRQPFTFGPGTEWAAVTSEIRSLIPVMLANRLTPPPRETYSLNRKLSGAFLLASRLGAEVDCRELWEEMVKSRNS